MEGLLTCFLPPPSKRLRFLSCVSWGKGPHKESNNRAGQPPAPSAHSGPAPYTAPCVFEAAQGSRQPAEVRAVARPYFLPAHVPQLVGDTRPLPLPRSLLGWHLWHCSQGLPPPLLGVTGCGASALAAKAPPPQGFYAFLFL